jgi:hypothetical protein
VATTGTAPVQGELWSARADDWASVHEPNMSPAYGSVLDLVHAGPGVDILEVGCGSGTALRLAADRGADGHGARRRSGLRRARPPPRPGRRRPRRRPPVPAPTRTSRSTSSWASTRSSTRRTRSAALAEARASCAPAASWPRWCGVRPRSASCAPHLAAVGGLLPAPRRGAPGPSALGAAARCASSSRRRLRGHDRRRRRAAFVTATIRPRCGPAQRGPCVKAWRTRARGRGDRSSTHRPYAATTALAFDNVALRDRPRWPAGPASGSHGISMRRVPRPEGCHGACRRGRDPVASAQAQHGSHRPADAVR